MLATTLVVGAAGVASVGAYPEGQAGNTCGPNEGESPTTIRFQLVSDDDNANQTNKWNIAARATAFRDGANLWEGPRDTDGDRLIEVVEPTGGTIHRFITWNTTNQNLVAAANTCNWIRFGWQFYKTQVLDTQGSPFALAWLEDLSAHEFGHALNLEHTADAVVGSNPALMTTCLPLSLAPQFSRDDEASLTGYWDDNNPGGWEPMHANYGFERGNLNYWSSTGGSMQMSSVANNGNWGLRYTPSAKGQSVYTDTTIQPKGALSIDAAGNLRGDQAGDTGPFRLSFEVRERAFANNGFEPGCQDAWSDGADSGVNYNVLQSVGNYTEVRSEQMQASGTAWRVIEESTIYNVIAAWDAIDVRVRLASEVANAGGGISTVFIDQVRTFENG